MSPIISNMPLDIDCRLPPTRLLADCISPQLPGSQEPDAQRRAGGDTVDPLEPVRVRRFRCLSCRGPDEESPQIQVDVCDPAGAVAGPLLDPPLAIQGGRFISASHPRSIPNATRQGWYSRRISSQSDVSARNWPETRWFWNARHCAATSAPFSVFIAICGVSFMAAHLMANPAMSGMMAHSVQLRAQI